VYAPSIKQPIVDRVVLRCFAKKLNEVLKEKGSYSSVRRTCLSYNPSCFKVWLIR